MNDQTKRETREDGKEESPVLPALVPLACIYISVILPAFFSPTLIFIFISTPVSSPISPTLYWQVPEVQTDAKTTTNTNTNPAQTQEPPTKPAGVHHHHSILVQFCTS